MDSLNLVCADDGVLQGGPISEQEDCVFVAALGIAGAADAAAVGLEAAAVCLEAAIEGSGDALGAAVGYAALGGRDREAEGPRF